MKREGALQSQARTERVLTSFFGVLQMEIGHEVEMRLDEAVQ